MDKHAAIFVAGSDTLIGSAIVRQLERQGYGRLVGVKADVPDLTNPAEVDAFFESQRPQFVFHAAGRSGGIGANRRFPADLCFDNLAGTANLLNAAYRSGVRRLLYLGASCCYPRRCPQPMRVESLGTGPLEETSEAYASAKLAGIALARAYRRQHGVEFLVGIPANAFGIGDHADTSNAHVVPALMTRMHEAKLAGQPSVSVWGTGRARREFVFADDLADACIFVMRHETPPEVFNLGSGEDISIRDLAETVRKVVGYEGRLEFDATKHDGAPAKSLDSTALAELGWRATTSLEDGLSLTYRWFADQSRTMSCAHAG